MCGIFAAIAANGVLSLNQRDFLTEATVTGQVRGQDGTGWLLRDRDQSLGLYKRALDGNDFLRTHIGMAAREHLKTATAMIGHNRKTTSGSDIDIDCHPYEYTNVAGVHNGGVPYHILNKLSTEGSLTNVDSAKLYAALDKVTDPADVLSQLSTGAYALMWIDRRTNSMRLARNKDRPLWAAAGDEGIYFASEPGMLSWLMMRHKLSARDSTLYEFRPHHVYNFPLDDPADITVTPYEPTLVTSYPTYTYNNNRSAAYPTRSKGMDSYAAKFMATPALVRDSYPSLRAAADCIEANMDSVHREYLATKTLEAAEDHVDVVITNIQGHGTANTVLTLSGYIQDVTESDVVVPVEMLGVKDDGWDLLDRFANGMVSGTMFTVRGKVRTIKVTAAGDVVVNAALISVWAEDSDVECTAEDKERGMAVDFARSFSGNQLTAKKLADMWQALRSSPLETSKGVH